MIALGYSQHVCITFRNPPSLKYLFVAPACPRHKHRVARVVGVKLLHVKSDQELPQSISNIYFHKN